jgi:hypothetical protein
MLSGADGPTTNGTVYSVADFPKLNTTMASGSASTAGQTNDSPAGWQPNGPFQGTKAGGWASSLYSQGTAGHYWSSTNTSAYQAAAMFFDTHAYLPSPEPKYYGNAVRCVMQP